MYIRTILLLSTYKFREISFESECQSNGYGDLGADYRELRA